MKHIRILLAASALLAAMPASAQDLVKMTIGQRGNWDTAVPHLGEEAGIFKKHGITLEMLYTSGSGETVQPVVSGNVDLGLAVGLASMPHSLMKASTMEWVEEPLVE